MVVGKYYYYISKKQERKEHFKKLQLYYKFIILNYNEMKSEQILKKKKYQRKSNI